MELKRPRTASTVAAPAAHSWSTVAAPSTGSADSVTLRPVASRPGARTLASVVAKGPATISSGIPIRPSAAAYSRRVMRAPGSTISGTEVSRRLWLKTPMVV